MADIPQNIAQTILDQAEKEADRSTVGIGAHDNTTVEMLFARSGMQAIDVQAIADKYAAIPRSRAGKVQAIDLASFAALVLRDYDAGSVVMADTSGEGVSLAAVLDYHHAIKDHDNSAGRAMGQRHGREVITYDPSLSDEWEAWTGQENKAMSQADFAQWIDDHLPDIADPTHLISAPNCTAAKLGRIYGFDAESLYGYATPDRMVELSRGLEIRSGEAVKQVVRLESGETSIQYEQVHADAAGKPLRIPRWFLLSIPVFKNESAYLVPVKLAYRKAGASVNWYIEIYRSDRFRDEAIKGMLTELGKMLTPADLNPPALVAPGSAPPEPVIKPVVPIHLAKRTGQ